MDTEPKRELVDAIKAITGHGMLLCKRCRKWTPVVVMTDNICEPCSIDRKRGVLNSREVFEREWFARLQQPEAKP